MKICWETVTGSRFPAHVHQKCVYIFVCNGLTWPFICGFPNDLPHRSVLRWKHVLSRVCSCTRRKGNEVILISPLSCWCQANGDNTNGIAFNCTWKMIGSSGLSIALGENGVQPVQVGLANTFHMIWKPVCTSCSAMNQWKFTEIFLPTHTQFQLTLLPHLNSAYKETLGLF